MVWLGKVRFGEVRLKWASSIQVWFRQVRLRRPETSVPEEPSSRPYTRLCGNRFHLKRCVKTHALKEKRLHSCSDQEDVFRENLKRAVPLRQVNFQELQ